MSIYNLILEKSGLPARCPLCMSYTHWHSMGEGRPWIRCGSCRRTVSVQSFTDLFYRTKMTAEQWRIAYRAIRENPNVSGYGIQQAIFGNDAQSGRQRTCRRMKELILEYPDQADYYLGEQ